MGKARKRLGEIMVEAGAVTEKQVLEGLKLARAEQKKLGEALIEQGAATDEQVVKALASQFRLPYVDPMDDKVAAQIDPKLIPEELIRKHMILPIGKERGRLKLVVHDPKDLEMLDMLRFRLNTEVDPVLASKGRIKVYIDQKLGGTRMVNANESLVTDSVDQTIDRSVDRSMDASIDQAAESAPIIKLCTRIIMEAVKMRASDIHIEPMTDRVRLRYRIDGVCMERDNLPKRMQNAVLARFKLMAGMNISEKRVPQDGRIKLPYEDHFIDFRVSACPAYHGESIVLRILRPDSVRIGLQNLGFEQDNLENFNRIIRRPNGIFLVTG
ncbi:MAG: Flp pilus assembly complex ATPase component TadA, partial [Phycisphaerales bacterium]|nr:Flp pilus assembly complex ATPase component TadA [Phycisphaerales bacterium]